MSIRPLALFCLLNLIFLTSLAGAEEMTAEEFLAFIRKPMTQECWMEITGLAVCKKENQETIEGKLRIKMSFSKDALYAQIDLNEQNSYGLIQHHGDNGNIKMEIDRPESEQAPGLFDFGLLPSDISFAFLYWDLIEELPRQTSRWRECRLMKLAEPDGSGYVIAWFNASHGFPLEVQWFKNGETNPWRSLEMKGVKRHENGLWFVREMCLHGNDWKTSIRFDFVSQNAIGE